MRKNLIILRHSPFKTFGYHCYNIHRKNSKNNYICVSHLLYGVSYVKKFYAGVWAKNFIKAQRFNHCGPLFFYCLFMANRLSMVHLYYMDLKIG